MIPTIRSMIVAMLLTFTVLVGGFGLFAAFRVNHEPLARLPVAATPFQLASVDSAPRTLSFASEQPRLESNDALRAVATAVSGDDPDRADATAVSGDDADRADAVAGPAAVSSDDGTDAAAPEHVVTEAAPDAAEPVNGPAATSAPANAATAELSPQTVEPQTLNVAAAPATDEQPTEQVEFPTTTASTIQPKAKVDSASPAIAQPEPAPPMPSSTTGAVPRKAAARSAKSSEQQETARQIANRKRLAALRRARRARLLARAQQPAEFTGFGQANFRSASSFQSVQYGNEASSFAVPSAAARRQN